jgi:ribosomal-protein-alanine N-acetyltransferase
MGVEFIGTDRLSLRSADPADFAVLYERVLTDPDVMRHVMAGLPLSREQAEDFFREKFDRAGTGRGLGVLIERASSEVVGFAGLLPCDLLGQPDHEIGFVLARRGWGRGYAQEIGRAQLKFGFGTLHCTRLLAQVAPENFASVNALTKIGMRLHDTLDSPGRGRRHIFLATATGRL